MWTLIFVGIVYVGALGIDSPASSISTYTITKQFRNEIDCLDYADELYQDNQAWNGIHGLRSSTITVDCVQSKRTIRQ